MNDVAAQLHAARRPHRRAQWITLLVLSALCTFLLWRGYDFYRHDLAARAEHPDYALLRPAGTIGHGYGIVGTALILTNLTYLARRRFAKILPAWLGSVKTWLDVHVVTGLAGALLVLFHSAFQLRTSIATVTAASLAIVVVTGIAGLYLHALLPTSALVPLTERLDELAPLLPGLTANVMASVKRVRCTRLNADASIVKALLTVPRWVLEARARRRAVLAAAKADKAFRVLERTDRLLARSFSEELATLAAAEIDTHAATALVRSWRSLHRFLAVLMVVSVTVHIAVAWFYGYRWFFSGAP